MALSDAQRAALTTWLADALGAERVAIDSVQALSGGAIQENLALDLEVAGGSRTGRHALVLRTDAPSSVAESRSRAQEFHLLQAAHAVGVKAPEPWLVEPTGAVLGRPCYLMARASGEARGVRLVRDADLLADGDRLVADIARELAKLHRLAPPLPPGLDFVIAPQGPVLPARIADLRAALDALVDPQPVLEWGLRWLERSGVRTGDPVLIHGDLRTGNYLVERGQVTAILDWEFARLSDPNEDLGWFLARCWRFGAYGRHAGGLGSRAAFLDAYEAASGQPLERRSVQHWELFATIRWGVIALQQALRHRSGREPSLELGLTAHVVPVLERDVLAYVEAIEEGREI